MPDSQCRAEVIRPGALFVPGSAAPQGSKDFKGRSKRTGRAILVESSAAVGPWRERVALAAHQHGFALLDGPVRVELEFVLPRPKATPTSYTPPAIRKPDLDKLIRAIFDALTGIAYTDDARVTEDRTRKRLAEIGETPGVWISVTDLAPLYAQAPAGRIMTAPAGTPPPTSVDDLALWSELGEVR